jgi:hypothetical protein
MAVLGVAGNDRHVDNPGQMEGKRRCLAIEIGFALSKRPIQIEMIRLFM